MKSLRQAVRDYLVLRRGLGFKLKKHERFLHEFVTFLAQKKASHITTEFALQWSTKHRHQQPAEWAARLSVVRGFARYWSGIDCRTEIPADGLLPYRPARAKPYIYSEQQIQRLLEAAHQMPASNSLKPRMFYCLFGLLAVTGMRISEVLNLQSADIDWSEGVLTIRSTKFGKSRLIPLHQSTQRVLLDYVRRRDRHFANRPVAHLFVSRSGRRLDSADVRRTFYMLSRQIGLRDAVTSRGPRLHDFRHRFAVQTLVRWYRQNQDPKRLLPILSTYLGHGHVTDTYWYLTNTPELLAAAGQRLEKRWKGLQ
jgi:integrase